MLQLIVDRLTYGLLGLGATSKLGAVLNFFIYDTIKIILLLLVMVAIVGFLRTYLPQDKIKRWIAKMPSFLGYFTASVFGAITPFCSCSSIPLFFSFLRLGIPLGVTFSFLVTSPMINEYLVVMMLSFFGWKITLAYVLSGMLIGIASGFVLGRMGLEKYIEQDMLANAKFRDCKSSFEGIMSRIIFGWRESLAMLKTTWVWILVGVGIGAIIHNVIPQAVLDAVISAGGLFTVPIATLIGVPIYGSCAAILPIAVALFQKGIPLGTALSFMMAVSALSLPSAVILRRAMKLRLIALFFLVVAIGIIMTGYLFNFLQPMLAS